MSRYVVRKDQGFISAWLTVEGRDPSDPVYDNDRSKAYGFLWLTAKAYALSTGGYLEPADD
jgi:hypothetical protein